VKAAALVDRRGEVEASVGPHVVGILRVLDARLLVEEGVVTLHRLVPLSRRAAAGASPASSVSAVASALSVRALAALAAGLDGAAGTRGGTVHDVGEVRHAHVTLDVEAARAGLAAGQRGVLEAVAAVVVPSLALAAVVVPRAGLLVPAAVVAIAAVALLDAVAGPAVGPSLLDTSVPTAVGPALAGLLPVVGAAVVGCPRLLDPEAGRVRGRSSAPVAGHGRASLGLLRGHFAPAPQAFRCFFSPPRCAPPLALPPCRAAFFLVPATPRFFSPPPLLRPFPEVFPSPRLFGRSSRSSAPSESELEPDGAARPGS